MSPANGGGGKREINQSACCKRSIVLYCAMPCCCCSVYSPSQRTDPTPASPTLTSVVTVRRSSVILPLCEILKQSLASLRSSASDHFHVFAIVFTGSHARGGGTAGCQEGEGGLEGEGGHCCMLLCYTRCLCNVLTDVLVWLWVQAKGEEGGKAEAELCWWERERVRARVSLVVMATTQH